MDEDKEWAEAEGVEDEDAPKAVTFVKQMTKTEDRTMNMTTTTKAGGEIEQLRSLGQAGVNLLTWRHTQAHISKHEHTPEQRLQLVKNGVEYLESQQNAEPTPTPYTMYSPGAYKGMPTMTYRSQDRT